MRWYAHYKMKLYGVLLFAFLLTFPVYASEDSGDYDETIDFSFDDLPPISTTNKIANANTPEYDIGANKPQEDTGDVSNQTDQTTEENKSDVTNKPQNEDIFIPDRPKIEAPTPNVIVPMPANNDNKITPDDTLTEQLKKNPNQDGDSIIDGTWIEKLTELSPGKLIGDDGDDDKKNKSSKKNEEDNLENMIDDYRHNSKTGKSNASVFDIAGIMLRMNVAQVEDVMRNRGFKKINARYQIPNFIKWRNEETCRMSGIVGYERTQACIIKKAKEDGYEYVQYLKFAKFESKEEMEVYFTSNFTENKVYKIEYRSTIAGINGNSPKAIYIRNLKVYDFWRRINRKYGAPDDKSMVIWGLGGNKPYLKAATGQLKLEDPMFVEMDYTRMSREDQKFIHSDFYNF